MRRLNDDAADAIYEMWKDMAQERRDRTAGNVPLYDERVRCVRCHAVLLDEARCSHCGRHI